MNDINHIWGPYLAMLQQEGNLADLYYKVKDNRVSPYLELQADNLYGNGHSGKYLKLDVNPYIRFLKIFEPLLSPDDMGYEEFNQALSDILLHYLADLDLKSGMCKQDFYTSFIVKDLESGAYGGLDELKEFTIDNKSINLLLEYTNNKIDRIKSECDKLKLFKEKEKKNKKGHSFMFVN